MNAIYQRKYGKSDVLLFGEQPSPILGPRDLRVKNHAASVNPRDWMIRSGRYQLQFLVPSFPLILGSDFAGQVIEVGAKVKGFSVGDRVFGMKNPSEGIATYAEEVVVRANNTAHVPAKLSYTEAAGVPLCALTAWQALVSKAGIKKGMKVLVIGGSGGVGGFAVQIASALGAKVTGVCSTDNVTLVASLGAENVIDYTQQDFLDGIENYDIIFDTIGKHSLDLCAKVLTVRGVFVSTIPSPKNLRSVFKTSIYSLVSPKSRRARIVMVKSRGTDLAKVADMIAIGSVRSVVDQVFQLQQAGKALDYSRSLRAKGKIILEIAPAINVLS